MHLATARSQMSSSSGTGTLPSLSPRKVPSKSESKKTNKIPVSLASVQDNAESIISKYNKRVESLQEKYKWEELLLQPDVTSLYLTVKEAGVSGKFFFKRDFDDFVSENRISLDNSTKEKLNIVGLLYDEFRSQICRNIQKTFTTTIIDGLCKFCLPLGELVESELEFVRKYEKDHLRFDSEVLRDLNDLLISTHSLNKLSFLKYLKDISYSCDLIKKTRSAINKLYYLVLEWVDADRNYIVEIDETLKDKKNELLTVVQDLKDANELFPNDEKHTKKQLDDLEKMDENIKLLKQRLHKCSNSIVSASARQSNLIEEERQKLSKKDELVNKLEKLEELRQKQSDSNQLHRNSNVLNEIRFFKNLIQDNTADIAKTRDNLQSINRHIRHQESLKVSLESDLAAAKQKKTALKNHCHRDKEQHTTHVNHVQQLEGLKRILTQQVEDLRLLKEKKNNSSSLRELFNTGHINSPRKVRKPIVAACQEVAGQIGTDWRTLYGQLPMPRTHSTRRRDVERLDVFGGRHDAPEQELAAMSLEKWRLFCPSMKPEDLLQALTRIDKQELADQLQHKYKYKK